MLINSSNYLYNGHPLESQGYKEPPFWDFCQGCSSFIKLVKDAQQGSNTHQQITFLIEAELSIGDGLEWLRSCLNEEVSEEVAKVLLDAISELALKKNEASEPQYAIVQEMAELLQEIRQVLEEDEDQTAATHYKQSLHFIAFCALGASEDTTIADTSGLTKLSESAFESFLFLIETYNEKPELLLVGFEYGLSRALRFIYEKIFLDEKAIDKLLLLLATPLYHEQIEDFWKYILNKRNEASQNQKGVFEIIDKAILRYSKQLQMLRQNPVYADLRQGELLHQALFIEAKVVPVKKVASKFFEDCETGLTCDLQVDFAKRTIYIIGLQEGGSGGTKTAYHVARLSFERDVIPTFAIQLKVPEEQEANFFKEFNGARGIVPLLHSMEVTDGFSLIFEKYDGEFSDFLYGKEIKLTIQEVLAFIKDVIFGLGTVHDRGFFHGDLNDRNLLYKRSSNGRMQGALCDFEFTRAVSAFDESMLNVRSKRSFSPNGLDFSVSYILGEDPRKAEMFTIGVKMLKWYFEIYLPNQPVSHKTKLDPFINEQLKLQEGKERAAPNFEGKLSQWCRKASENSYVQTLMRKKESAARLSMDEKFEWLMFSLLAPPEKRLSVNAARDALNALWL